MAHNGSRGQLRPHGATSRPPFVIIGLFVVIIILGFNYWNATSRYGFARKQIELLSSERLLLRRNFDAQFNTVKTDLSGRAQQLTQCKSEAALTQSELSRCQTEKQRRLDEFSNANEQLTAMKNDMQLVQANDKSAKDERDICLKNLDEMRKVREHAESVCEKKLAQRTNLVVQPDINSCNPYIAASHFHLLRTVVQIWGTSALTRLQAYGVNTTGLVVDHSLNGARKPENLQPQHLDYKQQQEKRIQLGPADKQQQQQQQPPYNLRKQQQPLDQHQDETYQLHHVELQRQKAIDKQEVYKQQPQQPVENQQQQQEPSHEVPGRHEPGRQEPGRHEPGRQEPGRQEPGRQELGRQEPSRQEPDRQEQGRREPGRREPGQLQRLGQPQSGQPQLGQPQSGQPQPGQPQPGQPQPGQPQPGQPQPGQPRQGQPQQGQPQQSQPQQGQPLQPGQPQKGKQQLGQSQPSQQQQQQQHGQDLENQKSADEQQHQHELNQQHQVERSKATTTPRLPVGLPAQPEIRPAANAAPYASAVEGGSKGMAPLPEKHDRPPSAVGKPSASATSRLLAPPGKRDEREEEAGDNRGEYRDLHAEKDVPMIGRNERPIQHEDMAAPDKPEHEIDNTLPGEHDNAGDGAAGNGLPEENEINNAVRPPVPMLHEDVAAADADPVAYGDEMDRDGNGPAGRGGDDDDGRDDVGRDNDGRDDDGDTLKYHKERPQLGKLPGDDDRLQEPARG